MYVYVHTLTDIGKYLQRHLLMHEIYISNILSANSYL